MRPGVKGTCTSWPALLAARSTPAHPAIPDNLIRLSAGIEDAADLLADLEQALSAAG